MDNAMKELLWLIPALPLAGALTLILAGDKLSRAKAGWVGCGSVGLSAIITLLIGFDFLSSPQPYDQLLWSWMAVEGFHTEFAFHLDALSMVFLFVITFVGTLIHIYSTGFMADDEPSVCARNKR